MVMDVWEALIQQIILTTASPIVKDQAVSKL